MSKQKLIESGVALPVLCPECGSECQYIQVVKTGNILTKKPEKYAAFFGCKPCRVINSMDCSQVFGEQEWFSQEIEQKNLWRDRILEFFGPALVNDFDDWFSEGEFE